MIPAGKGTTGISIVAHGERHEDATNAAWLAHAAEIRTGWEHAWVRVGVLDGEPLPGQALAAASERGLRRLIVYPYFMSCGHMVARVLPQRIGNIAPELEVSVISTLGQSDSERSRRMPCSV